MSSNTNNLGLYKVDPKVDGNQTFNIDTMLNKNWDKIDKAVSNISFPVQSVNNKTGNVNLTSEDIRLNDGESVEEFKVRTGRLMDNLANKKLNVIGGLNITDENNITPEMLNYLAYKIADDNFAGIGANASGQFIISAGTKGTHKASFKVGPNNSFINDKKIWHEGNDSELTKTKNLTAKELNNTKLASGMYTNSGQGLLKADGSLYHGGWFHVIVSKHRDENGYGAQLAIGFDSNNMFMRTSGGEKWHNWHKIWSEGNDDILMRYRYDIPDNVDLNTYIKNGYYHQHLNIQAATGKNYPVKLAGMLKVTARAGMIYQEYSVFNSGEKWVRSKYTTTWYPWRRQLSQKDYDQLFQFASNGKINIATAVAGRGIAANNSDTFTTLANKITQIAGGIQFAKGVGCITEDDYMTVTGLNFKPDFIMVGKLGWHTLYDSRQDPSEFGSYYTYSKSARDYKLSTYNCYVNSTGFKLRCSWGSGSGNEWIAIKF